MFPMLLTFLYPTKTPIQYWNTAFFAYSFVALWELIEFLIGYAFGTFFIFGPDNQATETVEDIVVLDLGNGVIGVCIGLLTMAALKPQFKKTSWWVRALMFLSYGLVYSLLTPYGICRGECPDPLFVPFGNIINYIVILIFAYFLYQYAFDLSLVYAFVFNAFVLNSVTMILFHSSVIMVYIGSGFLLLVWTIYYFSNAQNERSKRIDYNQINSEN